MLQATQIYPAMYGHVFFNNFIVENSRGLDAPELVDENVCEAPPVSWALARISKIDLLVRGARELAQ
eukprot:6701508-Alexandrium_andersonii.AAC.1